MKTILSRAKARKKLSKTPITQAGLAHSGFHIIGNEYTMADLTIIEWIDGFYVGTRKLNNMQEISNLVYHGR